jgi:antitoxin (DNA-binding transcriptional repressor) of toxin-antitoxin stability system
MYILCMTAAQPRDTYSDVEITVTDTRSKLPELIDTQVRDGGIVYLTRYGRQVGAVVPPEVAERFEHWEDSYWSRRAAEVLERDEPSVPWEQAITELAPGF